MKEESKLHKLYVLSKGMLQVAGESEEGLKGIMMAVEYAKELITLRLHELLKDSENGELDSEEVLRIASEFSSDHLKTEEDQNIGSTLLFNATYYIAAYEVIIENQGND